MDNVALNLHRIDKDVARCDRNYVYFLVPGNLDKLRNVVSTYVWQHLDVGYMQGMCDLVAPLLVVFDDGMFSCYNWHGFLLWCVDMIEFNVSVAVCCRVFSIQLFY